MSVTSTARVVTDRGERYRKQLASHFGNRIEVTRSPAGTVLTWGFGGTTTLLSGPEHPSHLLLPVIPPAQGGSPSIRRGPYSR